MMNRFATANCRTANTPSKSTPTIGPTTCWISRRGSSIIATGPMRSGDRPTPGRRADMGIRKDYRDLTDVERDRFVQALDHAKSTGLVDRFAQMHAGHFFMNIHRSSHFLPWHREMLRRFERRLQATFHPDVTIPYWRSHVDRDTSGPLWSNNFLGRFNSAWNLGRALGPKPNLGRCFGDLSVPLQVRTNQGRSSYDTFWTEIELCIHSGPHNWVGGVMADVASPGDPVFYLHHCWIDRL